MDLFFFYYSPLIVCFVWGEGVSLYIWTFPVLQAWLETDCGSTLNNLVPVTPGIGAWAEPNLSKMTVTSRLCFVSYYRTLLLCAAILSLYKIKRKMGNPLQARLCYDTREESLGKLD